MERFLPSDGCIHGHPVCVLHCRSDALTKWQTINDKDAELRDKDAELRDKDAEILRLRQENLYLSSINS